MQNITKLIPVLLLALLASCSALGIGDSGVSNHDLHQMNERLLAMDTQIQVANARAEQAEQDRRLAELERDNTLSGEVLSAMQAEEDLLRGQVEQWKAEGLDPGPMLARIAYLEERQDAHERVIAEGDSEFARLAALLNSRVEKNTTGIENIVRQAELELERRRKARRMSSEKVSG